MTLSGASASTLGTSSPGLAPRHKDAATVSFRKEHKEDGSAVIHKETADLVVGADGIESAVRAHLQQTCPGF